MRLLMKQMPAFRLSIPFISHPDMPRLRKRGWLSLLAFAAFAMPGHSGQEIPKPMMNYDKPYLLPATNRIPDANDKMQMQDQQAKEKNFTAANIERKKQIADDSARLLKLATDLKTEVDKTNKDTLSVSVIRKADEIERLAHAVREKMRASIGN